MPAGHNAARIIVGTEQNVIAAINGYNGHIGETAVHFLLLYNTSLDGKSTKQKLYMYIY